MPDNLITSDNVAKIDKERAKGGRYIPTPTKAELLMSLDSLKEWYQPRDMTFRLMVAMAQLNNPFGTDKDSLENREVRVNADGTVDYTVDSYPFAFNTMAQAMIADRHPYADVFPTHRSHTESRMYECRQFVQALLDTSTKRTDVQLDMAAKLVVLGWLPTLTSFDPALKKQGQNPFDLQIIDPMNFYPRLNAKREVMHGFIVQRVTGAQLIQDFSDFEAIKQLIKAEDKPTEGTPAYKDYAKHGCNLESTEFDLVRWYNDYTTYLLLGARDAQEAATKNNPVLKRLKEDSKKGKYGSVFSRLDDDDPYAGAQKHNLGGVPLHLSGCYPEALSPTVKMDGYADLSAGNIYRGQTGGRIVYYSALYPMYNDWVDRSKLRNMMYTVVDRYARPTRIIHTDNKEYFRNIKQGDTVFFDPNTDEKMETEKIDPMPAEFMTMFQELASSFKQNSFADSAYGSRAGSSARQQESVAAAGSRREEIIIRKIQQAFEGYGESALRTMAKRGGDEAIFAAGDGKAFEGAYTLEYKAENLHGYIPNIEVELKQKNALKDPASVAAFAGLQKLEVYPDKLLLGKVLDEPNPERIIQEAIKEKVSTHDSVIAPLIEVASLGSQSENLEEKWKLQEKVQLITDKYQQELHHKQIELDWSQLPQDKQDSVKATTIAQILAGEGGEAGGPPAPGGSKPPLGAALTNPNVPPMPGPPGAPPPSGMGMPPSAPMPPPRPPMMPPAAQGPRPPIQLPPPPGPSLPPQFAKGPGQADRPIQPISSLMAPGGLGRPGMPSGLMAGAGLRGTPIDTPAIEDANRLFAPAASGPGKKRKRGNRGRRK